MKDVSRRNFLKCLCISTAAVAFGTFPSATAFAVDNMIIIDPKTFIAEINAWYRANGKTITLDSIDFDSYCVSVEEYNKIIRDLKNIRVVNSVEYAQMEHPENEPREIMPVSFTRTATHRTSIYIYAGIYGRLETLVTINGTIDALRNNIISSSGSAMEQSSENLASSPNYSVSTTGGTPSSSDISYSVSVGAYFEWTHPNDNRKYRVHDSDTLTGHVSY